MIEAVTIQQAVETHQRNLDSILTDCAKEIEAAYKAYAITHTDNLRNLGVSKRNATKRKEDKSWGRPFEIKQKEYEEEVDSAQTLFQHSEVRVEDEFSVAMKSILTRYSGQVAREVTSFSSNISS